MPSPCSSNSSPLPLLILRLRKGTRLVRDECGNLEQGRIDAWKAAGMSLTKALLLVVFMLVAGCGQTGSSLIEEASNSAIIVVPGYYGTRLVQAHDNDLVWISTWEALFGSRSLALPLHRLGLSEGVLLRPDGILSGIHVVPPLHSVQAYGPLIHGLRRTHARQSQIIPLAYDWRGDLLEAVEQLHRIITDLRS